MGKTRIIVAASIDVEEEGLFSGRYMCHEVPLKNIEYLKRLSPLLEKGLHPTLFCVREAFLNSEARNVLEFLATNYNVEIGCHLHHWNTPPFANEQKGVEFVRNVDSCQLDRDLFDLKLEELFGAARKFLGSQPSSFRMGRWDLHPWQLALLVRHGIKIDASIRPCHAPGKYENSPDHFNFPADPFWLESKDGQIFEVPLTVFPIVNVLGTIVKKYVSSMRGNFKKWGVLALLPVYHPLWLMKIVTRMHIDHGGKVLSLTWHSSEMMPGGAPHMPDENSTQRLFSKLELWFQWLQHNFKVESLTMSDLREKLGAEVPSIAWPVQSFSCNRK